MSYGPPSRRPIPRGGIIGSAIAGVLALVGIVFAAVSCSGPSTPSAGVPTTTLVPVTVVPTPVTVVQPPPATVIEVTPVYTPPRGVNAGSGGGADPGEGGLDTGTVVLLVGGALLLGGGLAMARRVS